MNTEYSVDKLINDAIARNEGYDVKISFDTAFAPTTSITVDANVVNNDVMDESVSSVSSNEAVGPYDDVLLIDDSSLFGENSIGCGDCQRRPIEQILSVAPLRSAWAQPAQDKEEQS